MYQNYGITDAEYIQMWKEQEGKCKLCGKDIGEKYLDIDHDHFTGKIRGLLCRSCNLMLDEMFEKNIKEGKLKEYLTDGNWFQ